MRQGQIPRPKDVAFRRTDEGWRIQGGGVDLAFRAVQRRKVRFDVGLLGARLDWSVGRFSGVVRAEGGVEASVEGLPGWAERLDARWIKFT